MFEAWNQKMWNYASGLLLWMSHPAWPSMIWQTYSYDYETHGSFYGANESLRTDTCSMEFSKQKTTGR